MGRSPCCENVGGLKRGPWTPEEDQKLLAFIEEHGHGSWPALPAKAGLQRCGKSCRLRWTNYLRPDIKRGKFSLQEEQTIIQLHALLGNRWSAIANHLPKRTDNEIKNYWNTHLKKRLTKMGIDPVTHKPKSDTLTPGQLKAAATVSHIAQWESARLEAEARAARLVHESTLLRTLSNPFQTHLLTSSSAPPQFLLDKAAAAPPQPLCLDVLTAWKGAWLKTLFKENAISGGIFAATAAAGGTLESPTSTLNFSENQLPITATASFANGGIEADLGKSNNNIVQLKERMDNNALMQFEDSERIDNGDSSLKTANANADLLPNFVDGLTDLLLENSHDHDLNSWKFTAGSSDNGGESCGGDFEENRNYWDSILNLVNCTSPSAGSPVF